MNHKQKQKLARKLSGKQTNHFESPEWETRKDQVAQKVAKTEARQKEMARKRRERKMKILDDKGKEHKVGEIFESQTVTLEI